MICRARLALNKSLRLADGAPPLVAYTEKVQTSRVFLRGTTAVLPEAVLLFGGPIDVTHSGEPGASQAAAVTVDGWIHLPSTSKTAVLFRTLRVKLDALLQSKVERSSTQLHESGAELIRVVVGLLGDGMNRIKPV